jgi:TMEM175 potassium channel family protein
MSERVTLSSREVCTFPLHPHRQPNPATRNKAVYMSKREATPERMGALSDGVFAIVITILVLDLRAPEEPSISALLSLWPRALSYGMSYLFLAIVWVNHHYLWRHAVHATHRLVWGNFAHLFTVSLVPFATAWIAKSKLGAVPVAFYASVFVLVNLTYVMLLRESVDRQELQDMPPRLRQSMRTRSVATLGIFAVAAAGALKFPIAAMILICLCLVFYLRPEAPGARA